MPASPASPIIVQRELHLPSLPLFLVELQSSMSAKGVASDKARELISIHASAECLACAIKVKGDELLLLDPQSGVMDVAPKISRMRQGYCARQTCETYFYRLNFANKPDLDWAALLPEPINKVVEQLPALTAEQAAALRLQRKQLALRLAIAGGALLVLLLVRQFYRGGTIPFLREPEKFQVDRTPPPDLMKR